MSASEIPSAFPVNAASLGGPGAYAAEPGMTLRDWFASHATEDDVEAHREYTAELAFANTREQARYAFADAMLAARSEHPHG